MECIFASIVSEMSTYAVGVEIHHGVQRHVGLELERASGRDFFFAHGNRHASPRAG